jgi:hypothetical protein
MPNWCDNNLEIRGPIEVLKPIYEAISNEQEPKFLEAMVPIGEWSYGGALEAWGTKWEVSGEGIEYEEEDDKTAILYGWFTSAWGPPITAMNTFSEQNEDVYIRLSYFEPGVSFIGQWTSDTGENTYEDLTDLYKENEHEEDELLNELFEEFGFDESWFEEEDEDEEE